MLTGEQYMRLDIRFTRVLRRGREGSVSQNYVAWAGATNTASMFTSTSNVAIKPQAGKTAQMLSCTAKRRRKHGCLR